MDDFSFEAIIFDFQTIGIGISRDDSNMDMTAMAKIYNFFSFMNFDKWY